MKRRNQGIAVIGLIFVLLSGCGTGSEGPGLQAGGSVSPAQETTPVNVVLDTGLSASGQSSKILQAPVPVGITSMKIEVIDALGVPLITPVIINVANPAVPSTASFDVASGTGRTFKSTAFNAAGTPLYAGQTTVNLTVGVLTTVTIPMTPNTIFITPPSASIQPGQSLPLVASVVGLTNTALTWSVNNVVGGNIALGTISTGNPVTYVAPATAPVANVVTLTATSVSTPSISASVQVTIHKVASIEVTPTTGEVGIGQTQSFFAIAKDATGAALSGPFVFNWASSNPAVATINTNGLATAAGVGATNITASIGAITSNIAVFNVNPLPGVFGFSLSNNAPTLLMIPGETRTVQVTAILNGGGTQSVALAMSGLPAGTTAAFLPTTLSPTTGGSTAILSITTTSSTPLQNISLTVTGTAGAQSKTTSFQLDVRTPNTLNAPFALAIENGGATALVTESDRLVRVNLATKAIVKTIATGLSSPQGVVIEQPAGTTALVALKGSNSLVRIDLATGAVTTISTDVPSPFGIAVEASGLTALVTACSPTNDCTSFGRLVRVDLATGVVTSITPVSSGLNTPQGVAIEAGGTTALVFEKGGSRLLRIDLATGGIAPIANVLSGNGSVAIESGGTTALMVDPLSKFLMRVNLVTGQKVTLASGFNSSSSGGFMDVAIETGGSSAIVVDHQTQQLVRVNIPTSVTISPSLQSLETLSNPFGVAIEAGGTTALVTDFGVAGGGRLSRVNLSTGVVTPITSPGAGLPGLDGVTIEAGGTSALVVKNQSDLIRVDLGTGAITPIVTSTSTRFRGSVAIESSGATALVANGTASLKRVNLVTGVFSTVATSPALTGDVADVAIEAGGTSALIAYGGNGFGSVNLDRINLTTGAVTTIASGFSSLVAVKIETGGATAVVTEGENPGRLLRVNLSTGAVTVLASSINTPKSLAIEALGTSVLVVEGNTLKRLPLTNAAAPTSIVRSLESPSGLALEAGGATALFLDCGPTTTGVNSSAPSCGSAARLRRVNLNTGTLTEIVSGLNFPKAIAIESAGLTALVTDAGVTNVSSGRLLRVNLSTGTLSVITAGISNPDGIFIESGGTTALVAEFGGSRLLRVNLTTGVFEIMASGLSGPTQVFVEAGGTTALVAAGVQLVRVDLATKTFTTVARVNMERFAVESGGATAIVLGSSGPGTNPTQSASIYRMNLSTGGVDILMPRALFGAHTIVLEGIGGTALVTADSDHASAHGVSELLRFNVPAP